MAGVPVQAQYGYTEGFIIKTSGDTVKGFIKQLNSKKLSAICKFKKTQSAKSRIYLPSELSGFRLSTGKYYITKEYKTEKDTKLVFMEYLIKGKANIFYFRDSGGDHYLLEKENERIVELTEPQKYIHKEGYGTLKATPKYKGKLIAELATDCNTVQSLIQETKLSNASLTLLAKEYHDCVCDTERCIIFEKAKLKPYVIYSLAAGYSAIRYNFGNQVSTDYGSGVLFGLDVNFKRVLFSDEKFSFSTGIFFERDFSFTLSMHDKTEMDGEDVTYKGEKYTIDNEESFLTVTHLEVALNVSAIRVPIILNYGFTRNQFSIEGGLGISNRFILNSNDEFVYDRFDDQYGKTFRTYYLGPAFTVKSSFGLSNRKAIHLSIAGDMVTDPKSINQFLRLTTTQFTFRIGYTL